MDEMNNCPGVVDKTEPLVSVIMNCYNGEKYLHEAIDSVIAQTYQNWEIIFWNNQSTDQSLEIFSGYKDSRLKCFMAENHTDLYEARNCAVKHASGDFLAFLDVDDLWVKDKLQKQLLLFENESVGLVYGNYIVMDELSGQNKCMYQNELPTKWVRNDLLKKYDVGLLTIMVRRTSLDSLHKLFDPRFHIIGDFDFVLRMSVQWQFDCVQEPIAYYRQHADSESVKHRARFLEESLVLFSEMRYQLDFLDSPEVFSKYNLYLYHDAISGKIQDGNVVRAISIFVALPFSMLKMKLLTIILLPRGLCRLFMKWRYRVY